jgi:hypothetical protein
MGGWKLEFFKMTCYLAFPVGAYLSFSRPELFGRNAMEIRKVSLSLILCYTCLITGWRKYNLDRKQVV